MPRKSTVKNETKSIVRLEENPQCNIHKDVEFWKIDSIRKNVCVFDEPLTEFEGKFYCLFHLPTIEKDINKFKEKFESSLSRIEKILVLIEKDTDEAKKNYEKIPSYDFRYVWFPSPIDLENYKFVAPADFSFTVFSGVADLNSTLFSGNVNFSSATFSENVTFGQANFSATADFSSVNFSSNANFSSAKFSSDVNFSWATFSYNADFISAVFSAPTSFNWTKFSKDVSFSSAIFSANTSFSLATFLEKANFHGVTFSNKADFSSTVFSYKSTFRHAIFSDNADFGLATFSNNTDFSKTTFSTHAHFNRARFSKIGTTLFKSANFAKDVFFDRTRFRNEVCFNSTIFGINSNVFFRGAFIAKNVDFQYCTATGYLRFSKLRQGTESKFNFQEAAFEKASRISFHSVRLLPHWFVDVDVTKFVFTNCQWRPPKNSKIIVKSELDALHNMPNSHKLLTKTCWQLANNHEEMKSFPKASNFRKFANESKRLEDYNGWKVWSLHWWYWLSSFYGESPLRAGLVLAGILLLFAMAFMLTDFQVCPIVKTIPETACQARTLTVWESALQSLATATFQSIEYIKPNSKITTFIIILEKILAPLQVALLALAIRRKFMR